ncbi:MAG: pyridoxal phosphate-dependent aminotransferase [Chloroflexi bacterium]|nr:pyridoxal phosphate-dependent aminotransferase [Chloroflexota bacterium]MDA1147515.1 pyridoxal phosphate-dependent aminotransferase [Chloroflexota bacterium]
MPNPTTAFSRLGTETAFEVLARANQLAAEGRDIINLGIGQPDFKTPAHIVEAAKAALDRGEHGYTPAAGIPALRQAVAADLHRRHGAEVDPNTVLITPGAKPVMYFSILLFGEPGAEIMYPNPGFPIYESVIKFTGATPVPIELHESKGFAFSADEVLAKVNARTRLIILNSPSNPTGGVVPAAEIDKLVAGLEAYPDAVILSDEVYSWILYGGREHVSLLNYPQIRDRLILLEGWSKTYAMTGWRIGYGVFPPNLFPHAERLAVNSYSCVNAATQFAAIAALEGPDDDIHMMVKAFDERRELIVRELNTVPGFRCVDPGGAFYAFPNIEGTGFDSQTLQKKLLEEAGVAVVSGTSFGALGQGYLRFSYAASSADITRAVGKIRDLLS